MIKKIAIAAALSTAMLTAAPAFAQTAPAPTNTLVYNATATVGSICGVYSSAGETIPVNFNTLSTVATTTTVNVGAGSATYRCNSPVGFTRTISSANNGRLVRTGSNGDASNSIAFTISHGGGSGLGLPATGLTTPIATNLGNGFLSGQTGSVSFQVNGVFNTNSNANNAPGTTVFAGTYTDTVTISLTAL